MIIVLKSGISKKQENSVIQEVRKRGLTVSDKIRIQKQVCQDVLSKLLARGHLTSRSIANQHQPANDVGELKITYDVVVQMAAARVSTTVWPEQT